MAHDSQKLDAPSTDDLSVNLAGETGVKNATARSTAPLAPYRPLTWTWKDTWGDEIDARQDYYFGGSEGEDASGAFVSVRKVGGYGTVLDVYGADLPDARERAWVILDLLNDRAAARRLVPLDRPGGEGYAVERVDPPRHERPTR